MWQRLKEEKKPIVLYGTGDAADKIIHELDIRGISVSGIFASDGFVRDRYYAGHKVLSYSEACGIFGKMCVLLCFGSHRPDVMENIVRISRQQDLYAPDLPVAGDGLFDRAYYDANRKQIDKVRELLSDDQSRYVFDSVIEYKLSGRIDPLLKYSTPEKENWKLLFDLSSKEADPDSEKVSNPTDMNGPEKPDEDARELSFMDLGAYTGDTVSLFTELCKGKYSEIIAVEPERRNFRKLTENLKCADNVLLVNAASGSSDGTVFFRKGSGRGSFKAAAEDAHSGFIPVRQRSVDSILGGKKIDIIKMDIEGAEKDAINGAAETIRQYAPNMLIAAYHRIEDLFAVPDQVLGIRPDYRLFLRKDPCIPAWGVNCYFIR